MTITLLILLRLSLLHRLLSAFCYLQYIIHLVARVVFYCADCYFSVIYFFITAAYPREQSVIKPEKLFLLFILLHLISYIFLFLTLLPAHGFACSPSFFDVQLSSVPTATASTLSSRTSDTCKAHS